MSTKQPIKNFIDAIKFPAILILMIWGVHIFNVLNQGGLSIYGIYPRDQRGLWGILSAPMIHSAWDRETMSATFSHISSNSVPLFVLTSLIFLFYRKVAVRSFILIYLLTGISVWIFARSAFHIGASGVVYGLVSFVFWSGVFRRNLKSIVLALIIVLLYSGYLAGILPSQPGISWESHLLGGIVGILVAYIFRNDIEKDEEPKRYSWQDEEEESNFFLKRDTFNKTIHEREAEEAQRRREEGGWTQDSTW